MAEMMKISLAWSPAPRVMHLHSLGLPQGASVRDALQAAASDARFADLPKGHSQGIWNRRVPPNQALKDGDRLEIYRPLRVDPKAARRERFKKQGAKSAGLFAKRRPGAKAGY
jgi:uncharacterized protein